MSASFVGMVRRRSAVLSCVAMALLLLPVALCAQSPWERAALNLESTFTGPLARSLALVDRKSTRLNSSH